MWLIGGARAKTTRRAGDAVQARCATCGDVATHVPVTVRDGFHLFFVEVGSSTTDGYQCGGCGEVTPAADVAANLAIDREATGLEDLGAAPRRPPRALPGGDHAPATRSTDSGGDVVRAIAAVSASLPRVDDPGGISTARHRPKAAPVDDDRLERELAALKSRKP